MCVSVCTHVSVCNCYTCTIGYEVANELYRCRDLSAISEYQLFGRHGDKQKWMYSVLLPSILTPIPIIMDWRLWTHLCVRGWLSVNVF